jgi:type I restriction-modification system DNA methylase subunit
MSKYDSLDPRTQLEQTITSDLKTALEKRGYSVTHNGTSVSHAPGGKSDIVVSNESFIITFEVTKLCSSSQDREFQSIRDHLNNIKHENQSKKCYCVFSSPVTSARTIDSIRDHNQQRANERRADLRIMPLAFSVLELWLVRLSESVADQYPIENFVRIFDQHTEFIDDLRMRKLLAQFIFPEDRELAENVKRQEIEQDEKTLESLIKDLDKIENYMRQNGIATSQNAIDNLIYLIFMKLYDEKRERDLGLTNRLRSVENFEHWRLDSVDTNTRINNRAIHKLFTDIQQEGEFIESQMFTPSDRLVDSLDDLFIMQNFISIFSKYTFIGTKVDALGAVYEVLAQRAGKDIKVGQFFTPENVVQFMVKLAELEYKDRVLDPACGTGRFLIHSMLDMVEKVEKSDSRTKENDKQQVRKHGCFGTDIDLRIAKIAKMNMWIHGDGKSNIKDYNGLTLQKQGFNGHTTYDDAFDVVLTNPPLGALNYQIIPFVELPNSNQIDLTRAKIDRMPILPKKNITESKYIEKRDKLVEHKKGLDLLQQELAKTIIAADIAKLTKKIEKKNVIINQIERDIADLDHQKRLGQIEYEITGNTMKGGAMFLAAIWRYLKDNSYPEKLPEWRGGKMLIILDEGIFNTDDYIDVRKFIRTHFYIKAIISLSRDTFVPISNTSTKTSILYAVKKTDIDAVQREPIFFAHVENVGVDTVGKVCENDLDSVLEKYLDFRNKVIDSYTGLEFNKERFLGLGFNGGRV